MASRRPARRRTNYRPARRRTYRRSRPDNGAWIALLLAAAVVASIVHAVSEHPIAFTMGALATAGAAAAGFVIYRRRRAYRQQVHAITTYTLAEYQRMNATQFEHALAELCRRDGCTNVRVVGGKGDRGADVICTTPDGRKLVIQAKRYAPTTKVGDQAVQVVNGTYRDSHHADLAAIVTTSTFTKPALTHARERGIRPYDGTALAAWASRTGPAPWQ